MDTPESLPAAVYMIWWSALAIVLFVMVPIAVFLLSRTLRAARSVQTYMEDMLTAGIGIAGNTGAIPALNETIETAGALVACAGQIKGNSGEIVKILGGRAAQGEAR